MEKIKKLWTEYKHGIPLLAYAAIYLTWFTYLERTVTKHYRVIHMSIYDTIPFCELFIVPYLLWFGYIIAVVGYFFFTSKPDYYKALAFLCTGMTIFLIVSTLWPNGHHLRPLIIPRDNVFADMVRRLWCTDTPTNLWPSIHVYNSLGAHFAVINSSKLQNRKGIRAASFILASSIILSTMFLKQHSVFDVLTAVLMAGIMYALVYGRDALAEMHDSHKHHVHRETN